MTAPTVQTPGALREDTALSVGDTVRGILDDASLNVLSSIPPAVTKATGRPSNGIARRLRTQAAATFHRALTRTTAALDDAADHITRNTLTALKEPHLPAGLHAPSWATLKGTLRDAVTNALADLDDTLGRVFDAVAPGVSGVLDAQKILDELAANGLTAYVDATGRRWNIGSYAEMTTRTASSRLALAVQLHVMAGRRLDLVMVDKTSIEPGCPQCLPYEYRVLSVAGLTGTGTTVTAVDSTGVRTSEDVKDTLAAAVRRGLLHPNCRHFLVPFANGMTVTTPSVSRSDEQAAYRARQRQQALRREVDQREAERAVALTQVAEAQANRRLVVARARLGDYEMLSGSLVEDAVPVPRVPELRRPVRIVDRRHPRAREPAADTQAAPQGAVDRGRDLADRFGRGHTVEARLSGGASGASVEKVRLGDGTLAVRKVEASWAEGEARHEYLASLVADALGIDGVDTAMLDEHTVLTLFSRGTLGGVDAENHPDTHFETLAAHTRMRNGRQVGMLDYLVANSDRNTGNYLVDDATIHPIDHGSANFQQLRDNGEIELMSPFARAWLRADGNVEDGEDVAPADLVSPYSRIELDALRQRLGPLQAEFKARGGTDEWRFLMQRLGLLEAVAK